LRTPGAVLAPVSGGTGFGLFLDHDRRKRPLVVLSETHTKTLLADGTIAEAIGGGVYKLTPAGAARVRRSQAEPGEAFAAQHAPMVPRPIVDQDGDIRIARGLDPLGALRRLTQLRDANGAPWFGADEMAAASRIRSDWEAGQAGLTRGVDWTDAPRSGERRGPDNGRESAMARGLDARARLDRALGRLAPPLRRAVTALCLDDCGFETFERREGWPIRSAKVALKLALSQLASIRSS